MVSIRLIRLHCHAKEKSNSNRAGMRNANQHGVCSPKTKRASKGSFVHVAMRGDGLQAESCSCTAENIGRRLGVRQMTGRMGECPFIHATVQIGRIKAESCRLCCSEHRLGAWVYAKRQNRWAEVHPSMSLCKWDDSRPTRAVVLQQTSARRLSYAKWLNK